MGSCQVPSTSKCTSVGQKRCSLNDTSMVQMCASNYAYADYTKCAIGCMDGECMQCQSGEAHCADSSSYKVCGSNGQFATPVQCAAGQACSDGKCVALAVCSESARQCNGNEIQVCKGGQWALYTTCANTTTCSEAQGTAYCKENAAPAPTPQPEPAPAPANQNGLAGVVEGAVGVIVLLVVLGAIYYLFVRRKQKD
jgi:hypothetical protein